MLLHVKIKPNQRFDRIEHIEGEWQIRLKAPAIDGKANEHLIRYLSTVLDLPRTSIVLVKGHTSRYKTLEVNASGEKVLDSLKAALTA